MFLINIDYWITLKYSVCYANIVLSVLHLHSSANILSNCAVDFEGKVKGSDPAS